MCIKTAGVKPVNCAAPSLFSTVISKCAELTLILSQFFSVGFSCAEKYYFSAHEKPTGNNCARITVVVNFITPSNSNRFTPSEKFLKI